MILIITLIVIVLLVFGAGGFYVYKNYLSANRPCPANCSGNGSCIEGVCVCSHGWGGPDCSDKNTCPSGYKNPPDCKDCAAGYVEDGNTCVKDLCNECRRNGGKCSDPKTGKCICLKGARGKTCQVPCSETGTKMGPPGFVDGKCVCEYGFAGETCDKECPKGTIDLSLFPLLPTSYCNSSLGLGECVEGSCQCRGGEKGGLDKKKGCGLDSSIQMAVNAAESAIKNVIKGSCKYYKVNPTAYGEDAVHTAMSNINDKFSIPGLLRDVCNCKKYNKEKQCIQFENPKIEPTAAAPKKDKKRKPTVLDPELEDEEMVLPDRRVKEEEDEEEEEEKDDEPVAGDAVRSRSNRIGSAYF